MTIPPKVCAPQNCGINPAYAFNQVTCKCECNVAAMTCMSPSTIDQATCSCKCPNSFCNPGFYMDQSCNCVCQEAALTCMAPSTVDKKLCQCVATP